MKARLTTLAVVGSAQFELLHVKQCSVIVDHLACATAPPTRRHARACLPDVILSILLLNAERTLVSYGRKPVQTLPIVSATSLR